MELHPSVRECFRPWIRSLALALVVLGGSLVLVILIFPACRRWRRRLLQGWTRAAAAVLHLRIEVRGTPPRPPFLLVANHLSYLDVLVLASRVPGCLFVAKSEVRRWPLLGPICRGMGTLFVERGCRRHLPRLLAAIEEALARGEGVVFFPEGTSTAGDTVAAFRSPLLAVAARAGRPVHPAVLEYRESAACWWGEMDLVPHLWDLLALPRIEAVLDLAGAPVVERDRKRLAERLHAAVLERFRPAA